jgi:hypothetical protein
MPRVQACASWLVSAWSPEPLGESPSRTPEGERAREWQRQLAIRKLDQHVRTVRFFTLGHWEKQRHETGRTACYAKRRAACWPGVKCVTGINKTTNAATLTYDPWGGVRLCVAAAPHRG